MFFIYLKKKFPEIEDRSRFMEASMYLTYMAALTISDEVNNSISKTNPKYNYRINIQKEN